MKRKAPPAADAVPPQVWRSPRRRSALTSSLGGILEVVLGRGTDRQSLCAARATCQTLRRALARPGVALERLAANAADIISALPRAEYLVDIRGGLAENIHLQLEDGMADVASLAGRWDQYVVCPKNWRAPWPASRNRVLRLEGEEFETARRRLSTRWRGVTHVDDSAGQLYVDEGACVRFEYAPPAGLAARLLGVEILSSRWTLSAEMRENREIRALRDDASDSPVLRVYKRDAAKGDPSTLLRGETVVRRVRASTSSADFGRPGSPRLDAADEWTYVSTVSHNLVAPPPLGGSRIVVEVDCREHDCNAAIHNVYLRVAY